MASEKPKESCKTEIKDRNDYIIRNRRYVFRSGHESVCARAQNGAKYE